jgi:hypothetical protein
MELNNASAFGSSLLKQFLAEGWGSLSKRDLELLAFILLEKDGCLDRAASNYTIGKQLRVTQQKVASLRRDAYARWRPLIQEEAKDVLTRIIHHAFSSDRLSKLSQYATERRMNEGFIPLTVEHPDDRMELENAIKEAGGVPIYERNREVLLVHYKVLIAIAFPLGIVADPKKTQRELKRLVGDTETLRGFLTKPLSDITGEELRDALNDAGASVLEEGITKLPDLLRLVVSGLP